MYTIFLKMFRYILLVGILYVIMLQRCSIKQHITDKDFQFFFNVGFTRHCRDLIKNITLNLIMSVFYEKKIHLTKTTRDYNIVK